MDYYFFCDNNQSTQDCRCQKQYHCPYCNSYYQNTGINNQSPIPYNNLPLQNNAKRQEMLPDDTMEQFLINLPTILPELVKAYETQNMSDIANIQQQAINAVFFFDQKINPENASLSPDELPELQKYVVFVTSSEPFDISEKIFLRDLNFYFLNLARYFSTISNNATDKQKWEALVSQLEKIELEDLNITI